MSASFCFRWSEGPAELWTVTRAHVIAWRKDLEGRQLSPASIRRKLSALSSLFDYLCERNAVSGNPVDGVKRPMSNGNEGTTPALGDAQVRKLVEAPPITRSKAYAIAPSSQTLLYHGIRREELCSLRMKDMHSRQGVMHFKVTGKRDKIRFVPVYAMAQRLIGEYLARRGPCRRFGGPVFRPVTTIAREGWNGRSIPARSIAISSGNMAGDRHQREVIGLCVHSLRATAATNAL